MALDRTPAEVPPHVLEYLHSRNTLTLATATVSGLPHAATLVYAGEGLALYFCTRPDTRTARYLAQNPAVSFTIDDYSEDWRRTRGIQGSGEARQLLSVPEIREVVRLFRAKFSALRQDPEGLSFFHELCFFRITPSVVEYIDNRGESGEDEQALGMEYHRSLAYSVFRGLPKQEVESIAGQLKTMDVGVGDVIVRQGAPADKFFIIVDGEVEVVQESDGVEARVAVLHRGQFFGEIAILRDVPRTATVRAVTAGRLLTMDRETFRSLVAQSLSTTEDFDRIIRERLTTTGADAPDDQPHR